MILKIAVILLLSNKNLIYCKDLNIVFWIDPVQENDFNADITATLKEIKNLNLETEIIDSVMVIPPDTGMDDDGENFGECDNQIMKMFCDIISSNGISVVIDFTYMPWQMGLEYVKNHSVPYLRVDRVMKPVLQMFAQFLQQKQGTDLVMLMQNEQDTMEAIQQLVEGVPFRALIMNSNDKFDFIKRIRDLRPSPTYYAIFARGTNMNIIFEKIINGSIFNRPTEWHFVFLDAKDRVFKFKKQAERANKLTINAKNLCKALRMKDAYCLSGFTLQRAILLETIRSLIDLRQMNLNWLEPIVKDCNATFDETAATFDILDNLQLTDFLTIKTPENEVQYNNDVDEDDYEVGTLSPVPLLTYNINVSIGFYSSEHEAKTDLALWQNGELKKINQTLTPTKRYFRIGTAESIPWSYYRKDSQTGNISLDYNGNPIWEGFCIDFIETLSIKMNFDYEIVPPVKGKFGERDPVTKQWDGVVGDLVSGETDFAVGAIKMYSDREEVIDFIAPYFEQTGISIVMRKPVRQTSLFKFMTVLRVEVWLSIIAALVATALMIWLLEKYSPYSSRNNKEAYPYPCREFTLRESFWFALTSFTPQGGGEAPKAVSGRILVAAYWLFVVLMLATFTANLAAFLTVERMQTPVQSLEQLARQSRINYTVIHESDTHHYFINMKFAEDTLYTMWKELSLNASRDFHKFRIWDYPIKEQYGHILLAINGSMPVKDAEEGFRKVNEHENADFAFIHDSSEIKYEITRNCNFTEVGEVFAEQPYAIAVQQGSHLADEISIALLELQKDRYFEELKAKYWNHSSANCPRSEEQEGITLESLGGVFIATLFGLALALITLAIEVFYHKKKNSLIHMETDAIVQVKPIIEAWLAGKENKKTTVSSSHHQYSPPPSFETATFRGRKIPPSITLGEEFKPGRFGLQQQQIVRRPVTLKTDEDSLDATSVAAKDDLPKYME